MEIGNRPWGTYYVLLDDDKCKVKKIVVNPNSRPSYQYHFKRSETWIVVEGEGKVTIDGDERIVQAGDIVEVPMECKHRIENTNNDSNLIFIEVQHGSYFGEDDIVRVEDDYDR